MIETIKSNEKLWDLYTRKEEYSSSMVDKHNRFSYRFSNNENVLEPEVSRFLIEKNFDFHWQDEKKFAVCLSHDIDEIYPSWRYRGFTSLKLTSRLKFKKALDRFFKKENPYWSFKKILQLEKKYDATSSFYIMADGSYYDLIDLKDELHYMVDNGHEVGLHGGYDTYNDAGAIAQEKEKLEHILEKKIIGYRNHFLRFKIPNTWELLCRSGFKYDTTLSYFDMVGFRNGMCHPFKPFNLHDNKEIDIIEIPLVIMDGALFRYMDLDEKQSWQMCKQLIDTVENMNGVVTIVWHNTSFDEVYYKVWGKLYNKILKYCHEKNAWMTSGEEIWKWWTQKKSK